MDLPVPASAVSALAAFVRERLAEVSDALTPLLRANTRDLASAPDRALGVARQAATIIVGATAPFAPTSYSRVRLIRQMHASGLLTDDEIRRATAVLELPAEPSPASF